MNPHFQKTLEEGIKNYLSDAQYVAVHVSSWHMSIFYEYYTTFEDLVAAKGYEYIDPMCYSEIREVLDLKDNKMVYSDDENYDVIGLISNAKQYCELHKDDPNLKPKIVEPETFEPLTEERLLAIATKNSKHI